MEFEEGSNVVFLPVNISNEDGRVDEIGGGPVLKKTIIPWFSLFQRFFHQFLGDAHQSFSKSIALWMVWAAGDVVHLIGTQKVVELPGTVTRSIVQS